MDNSEADINSLETLPLNSGAGQSINNQNISSSSASSSKRNYSHTYFSLNDIMALSVKVPSLLKVSMPKMGFLDPSSDCEDIEKGTKLELPLWLAKDMHSEGLIEVNIPKGFNTTYREILEADATVVNLNKLNSNYYRFGEHLSQMGHDESEDIAKSLVNTFHQRYHRLINYSLRGTDHVINDVMNFQSQLENDEKHIFENGRKSMKQIKNWENRSIEKVTANEMVTNFKKRKRVVMEEDGDENDKNSPQT